VHNPTRFVTHRLGSDRSPPPLSHDCQGTNTVEAQTYVWPFPRINESPRAVSQLLAPQAQGHGVLVPERPDPVQERLVQVEPVLVKWTGAADAPILQPTFQLGENPKRRAEMEIAVEHVALQEVSVIAVTVLWSLAEGGVVVELAAFAHFANNR